MFYTRIRAALLALLALTAVPAWAQKLSALPAAGAITGTEVVPVVQGGVTSQSTPAALTTYTNAHNTSCSNNQVPYANSGAYTCSANLTWVDSTTTLTVGNTTANTIIANRSPATGSVPLLRVQGANATSGGSGASVDLRSGNGQGTGSGGAFSEEAGNAGTAGNGGGFTLLAGNAAGVGVRAGGAFNMTAGVGADTGAGGDFNFTGGLGGANGAGGRLFMQGGTDGAGTSSNGSVLIPGGLPSISAVQPDIVLTPVTGLDSAHSGGISLRDFNGDNTLYIDAFGNVVCACATATNATDQFLYLGASSGVPTGVPAHITGAYANSVPVRYDTSGKNLYAYAGGWNKVGGATPAGSTNAVQYNAGSGALGGVSAAADQVVMGTSGAPTAASVPLCGDSTHALSYNTSTHAWGCVTISSGGNTTVQAVKTADTTRTSNATASADPDLTGSLTSGFWAITGNIQFNNGPGGARLGMSTTTVSTTAISNIELNCEDGAEPATVRQSAGPVAAANAAAVVLTGIPLGFSTSCSINGTVRLGSSDSVFVSWAQSTSNGTGTVLRAGSWLKFEKLQ